MNIDVTKRSGGREHFDAEKINETIVFACEGLEDVSASHVAMKAELHLYDGIKTTEVQSALIQAAYDLTDEFNPNYNIVAGRLLMYDIRKRVFGEFEPRDLYEVIQENIELGKYDKDILNVYTREDVDVLNDTLDHDKDMLYTYPAALTWEKKYLMRSRVSGEIYETPQIANMLISMCLFSIDGVTDRIRKVKDFYIKLSNQKFSLPTPIMAGVRSPTKQFSSCCLIDSDDSLDSINAAGNAIVKYASKRAGIGINGGRIRAQGSPIRNGEASHTGVTNFFKKWQADLHSCSQGGLRSSAATLFYPWWHTEIESMLVLKNNKGTEENRVRHMDYSLQVNKFFYQRVMNKEKVYLFSPSDVPGLYTSFFADQDEFARLYEKYSADPSIRKKEINSMDLMILFANERASTGRIYLMNVDHANDNSPFDKAKSLIYTSNLCMDGDTEVTVNGDIITMRELNDRFHTGEELSISSYSHESGKIEDKKVVDSAMTGKNQKVMKITDSETGEFIVCTPDHKVFTQNRGYVMAKDLKADDKLLIK